MIDRPIIIAPDRPVQGDRMAYGITFGILTFTGFAGSDAAIKWLSAHYSVLQSLFISCCFAYLPVGLFVARLGSFRAVRPKSPGYVVLRAVLVTGSAIFTLMAFARLPLTDGYAIAFSGPILVTLLSGLILGESVGWRRWAAVVTGFLGVVIMLRPGFQALSPGHLFALIATTLFALSVIVLRRLGRDESVSALLLIVLTVTLVVVGPLMLPLWKTPSAPHLAVMALAGLCSGSAQIFLVQAFREAPVAVVAPFQYIQMVWAVLLGLWLFNDRPDPVTLAGAAVVIASGLYILWRETRALPAAS